MPSRPAFLRHDTDKHGDVDRVIGPAADNDKVSKSVELQEIDSKLSGDLENNSSTDQSLSSYEDAGDGFVNIKAPVETAKDLITNVIHVDDDPQASPWTFRLAFLGCGLSIFGAVLQEIFYFKPQVILVSVVFLTVIAYILGELMAFLIPRWGWFRYLNPGPFNQKEHAAIAIMASAAAQAATSTEALAAQQLFYGGYPNRVAGVFVTISSQLLGFGIAGVLRDVLIYPTRMIWPMNLPTATLLETLHRDKRETKRRLKVFYAVFACLFVWEIFPEYIFTTLTGVSIFCLADQHNLIFTNLFGGSAGNEGLGFLNFSFDWNYVAGLWSPLWYPFQTMVNMFIGMSGCYILFMGLYYGNVWDAQNYPFMSQLLFNTTTSTPSNYVQYNQTLILNDAHEVDQSLVSINGLPALTATYLGYLITSNMGLTAGLVHMLLWSREDISLGWKFLTPSRLRDLFRPKTWVAWWKADTAEKDRMQKLEDPAVDPHYKLMLRNRYKECPQSWWFMVFLSAWIVGLVCLYVLKSTLPWWGFVVATIITFVWTLFFGALMGGTGFQFNVQPISQVLAGYLFPRRPLANLYFTCYTFNTLQQAQLLGKDMKLAQYVHLAPRCTFVVQCAGCIIGALFNWIMMVSIVQNQAPILTSVEGTNIWSGQNIQQINTLAVSFAMAHDLYSVGKKYQWVTLAFLLGFIAPLPFYFAHRATGWRMFKFINTSIILWFMGNLFVGINAGYATFYVIAFYSQFYLRRYKPLSFIKWNYLVSAALDGGTQVIVFILSFAVFGAGGKDVPFPNWAGNPDTSVHNPDYCMVNPANSG